MIQALACAGSLSCGITSEHVQWTVILHLTSPLLGVFTNLQKATVSFMMPACMGQLGCHCTDFHEI
jgi:hypothetical protein